MKELKSLKVGDQVKNALYGNTLTVTAVEKIKSSIRIEYTAEDGSKLENTYSGRSLNLKIKLV